MSWVRTPFGKYKGLPLDEIPRAYLRWVVASAEAAAPWRRRAMLDGMSAPAEPVPVEVEVSVGPTWGG